MKLSHLLIPLAILALVVLPAHRVLAQDTLVVEWQNPDQSLKVNSLLDAFNGDTLNRPAGRVYKLHRGGYYALTDPLQNDGRPLRIVGELPGPGALENPAVIQIYRRADNSVSGRMMTVKNDLLVQNVWITGADDIGTQTAYQPIQVDGSGFRITFDNVIFDRSNFAIVAFQSGANNTVRFINSKFRNLIGRPSTQQWEGRGVSVWADQDSVIIENCTFFNVEFTAFQMENGAAKYVRFNHNTLVNIGRNFLTGAWWRKAIFSNCLLINAAWQGEGVADYNGSGRDPRAYNSGMLGVGALPSLYGPEQGRSVLAKSIYMWRDPQFTTYYGDTIRAFTFTNRVAKEDFLDKYPDNFKLQDTVWLGTRPNIMTFGAPDTLLPKMWANITDLRRAITPATPYFFDLPTDAGAECYTCVGWPLKENFSYSTPGNLLTAGTDGLPIGDLNWFPAQKATFETNKETYIQALDDMAPKPPTFVVDTDLEAENGTLGNGATILPFSGFAYFQMDGGGFFKWNFNVANAGPRNLRVLTNMRGNDTRGQHTRFNGVAIHDSAFGYGELIYSTNAGPNATNSNQGMPLNEWTWAKFDVSDIKAADRPALDLQAGANTLEVASSWGYQNFAEFDLVQGTDTIKLKAVDVSSFAVVQPKGEGAPWVPNFFKSVDMGTNGTVTWNINPATAGSYAIQLYYQNYGTTQTAAIAVDGITVVPSASLVSKSDSTGLTTLVYPPSFALSTGAHELKVTASGIRLDHAVISKVIVGAVEGYQYVPGSFALAQNYPNPFNPSTTIRFSIGKASPVKLSVYNLLGQLVATLVDGRLDAGEHTATFSAKSLASGVYFYRLEAGNYVSNKKMLLLK
jgi:hypothetical protein